ncbi:MULTISPECIES: hypothetical protein [unclassified Streptomyces]|uniref:hypothetical protein n=1 Tax=unclassified Streptomyces TaxID=2593676 RepID=UPI002DDB4879|nr:MULTISPECIES: hypothetical protein [unclassified Streptomyces]WSD95479.1 hypothetical protein OG758_15945 [Streptomyces sp. NBC_01474]
MSTWFPLTQAWVAHPRHSEYGGRLELAADADPSVPLVPGQEVQLAVTVQPAGGAYRTYGYLMDDLLGTAAVMPAHKGLAHLAKNGRYATYATGTEPRTVISTLRIRDDASEGAVVLPRVSVGVMLNEGDKLISSSAVSEGGFRVRRAWLPGRSVMLRPGARVTIPAGFSPVQGLRLTGATCARYGVVTCAPDGSVTYRSDPTFQGYDHFACSFEVAGGHVVWSEVTLFMGDLAGSPGALPLQG